ncbi:MAG: thioredoxin family protein [Oscillospiraceae bacterium]|nr:thioredoxin family protein [Oscillospiraceae bacterium]
MALQADAYPAKSPLIAPELEGQLKLLLDKLTAPVAMVCLVGEDEKSGEMAAFLNHVAGLSPKLSCKFLRPGEDAGVDGLLDASLLPATGIYAGGEFGRMVFHGVPGGKEITGFAAALLNAGGAAKPLDKPTMKDIGKIKKPVDIRVCVSLACHHCAQLVASAQRVAWENPLVTAHMIDANLYPDLVSKYQIQRVPLTVLNGDTTVPGGKTVAELTTLLTKF